MLLSINQLWEITGRDRKTITKKLENLAFTAGEKGAHLYESTQALPLIYSVDNLEQARAKQALSQASLNALREEDLRKQRIPVQIALDANDQALQSFASTLKAAKHKKLTPDLINELLAKLRDVPAGFKWT
jgi:hypothetical protein